MFLGNDEIEEHLADGAWAARNQMEGTMDEKLNHIEHDLRYQDARRPGCAEVRGGLNLGERCGYDFTPEQEQSSWWLVLIGVVAVSAALYGLGRVF